MQHASIPTEYYKIDNYMITDNIYDRKPGDEKNLI